jgi:hypothetical protein
MPEQLAHKGQDVGWLQGPPKVGRRWCSEQHGDAPGFSALAYAWRDPTIAWTFCVARAASHDTIDGVARDDTSSVIGSTFVSH